MAQVRPDFLQSVEPAAAPPNDYQNIRATPQDFGAQVGQAETGLGRAGVGAGEAGLGIAIFQQERHNEVSNNEALNQYQQGGIAVYDGDPNDPNKPGLKSYQGRAALDQVPKAQQSLEDLRNQIRSGLQNDKQRLMFDADSRRFTLYMRERIGGFYDEQHRSWTSTVNADQQKVALQGIVSNPTDDTNFNHNLEDMRDAAVKEAQRMDPNNTEPAVLTSSLMRASTAAAKARIEALAPTNPTAALNWLENGTVPEIGHANTGVMIPVRQAIDPAVYDALYRSVKGQNGSALGRADGDDIWRNGVPGAAPTMPGGAKVTPVSTGGMVSGSSSRDNNVGNIRASEAAWEGKGEPQGGFETFATPEQGVKAAAQNLITYSIKNNGKISLSDAITRWAPPSENDTASYIKSVSAETGIGASDPIPINDVDKMTSLVKAMTRIEKGKVEFPDSVFRTGVAAALGNQQVGGGSQQAPADQLYPDEETMVNEAIKRAGDDTNREFAAVHRVREHISEYKLQTANERASLMRNIGDLKEALPRGVDAEIPTQQIYRLLPKEQADATVQELTIRSAIGAAVGGTRFASPEAIQQTVSALESGTGTAATLFNLRLRKAGIVPDDTSGSQGGIAGFGIRQRALDILRPILDARAAALTQDPAGYAASEETVASAMTAYTNASDADKPGAFDAYAQATRAVQSHLGVPDADQRVLPAGQSVAIAKQLLSADPTQVDAGAQLDGLAKTYGARWGDVWHDLVRDGKMPSEWQVLAQMEPGAGRLSMQRALQAANAKGGIENLRKDVGQQNAQDIDRNINDALADFGKTVFSPGYPGATSVFNAVHSAVRTLAYWNTLGGQTSSAALEDAVTAALPYDFEHTGPSDVNAMAMAPKGMGATAAATGRTMLATLRPDTLQMPANLPGLLPKDRDAAWLNSVQRNGFWVTNGRADGWVLAMRGLSGVVMFPTDDRGQRIGFRFDQMPAIQSSAPQITPTAPESAVGLGGMAPHQEPARPD